jgi:hypothetical protein
VIGTEGIDVGLTVSLPPGNLGAVGIPPTTGKNIPNIVNPKFGRLSGNGLDGVLGGTEGIHLSPNSGLGILKMNSIIGSGLDKRKGGVGRGFTGASAPAGHGLGPKGTDPLSPFNHPGGQVGSTVLRGT